MRAEPAYSGGSHCVDAVPREDAPKSGGKGEAGFTLVELMFASGVLAMTLVLLFGSMLSVSYLAVIAQDRANATALLTSVLEEAKTKDYTSLLAFSPPVSPGKPVKTIALQCLQADGTKLGLPVKVIPSVQLPNPLRLVCTVNWTDSKGRTLSVTASAWHYR